MSFVHSYYCLFKITVIDDASSKILETFSMTPAVRSLKQLDNFQLTFKELPAGLAVYYRTNPAATPPLLSSIKSRVQFSFCLYQPELNFFQRYKPDLNKNTGPQLYFDNLTSTGRIQVKDSLSVDNIVRATDAVKIYPHIFYALTESVGGQPAPTKLRVRDKFNPNNLILEVPIKTGGAGSQVFTKLDLSGRPSGPYTLETDAAGSTPMNIYLDDDLASVRILGLVDIHWETPQDTVSAGGIPYFIKFQKR
jgi:hypothetical protein